MKKTRFYAFGPLNVMFLTFCGPHAAAAAQFSLAPSYATGSTPCSVAVADLNGDSKLDLVVANSGSNNVSVLFGNGDGTFQPAVNYSAGTAPSSVASGDFNGDGKLDIVVTNASSSSIWAMEMAHSKPLSPTTPDRGRLQCRWGTSTCL